MQTYLRRIERRVEAGGIMDIPCPGNFLLVKEATGPFDFQFDDGEVSQAEGGFSVEMAPGSFKRIKVTNRSATTALNFVLYVGSGKVAYDYLRQRSTETVIYEANLPDSQGVIIRGISTAAALYVDAGVPIGSRREHMVVTNLSETEDIKLQNSSGDNFGTVFPRQARTIYGAKDVTVANESGGAIDIEIEAHYYV